MGVQADYCLSEPVPEKCGFTANLVIILIIAICNLGKIFAMAFVAYGNCETPLITVGDAI